MPHLPGESFRPFHAAIGRSTAVVHEDEQALHASQEGDGAKVQPISCGALTR